MRADEIVERADQLIHQEGQRMDGFGAGGAGIEAPTHFGATSDERRLEYFDDALARRLGRVFGQRLERGGDRAAVDDLALVGNVGHRGGILHRRRLIVPAGQALDPIKHFQRLAGRQLVRAQLGQELLQRRGRRRLGDGPCRRE